MAKILVVDDKRDHAILLSMGLRRQGYDVDMAYNGEEGIARLRSGNYDAIISDYMMPKATGADVVKEARARRVRTIIVTATSESDAKKLSKIATRVFRKPYEIGEIVGNVAELVGK